MENANIYAVTLTILDVFRAISVFWICCSQLCCHGVRELWVCGVLRKRLSSVTNIILGHFRRYPRSADSETVSAETLTTQF